MEYLFIGVLLFNCVILSMAAIHFYNLLRKVS